MKYNLTACLVLWIILSFVGCKNNLDVISEPGLESEADSSLPPGELKAGCNLDGSCTGTDLVCNKKNACIPGPACSNHDECKEMLKNTAATCLNGKCLATVKYCTTDADCPTGGICKQTDAIKECSVPQIVTPDVACVDEECAKKGDGYSCALEYPTDTVKKCIKSEGVKIGCGGEGNPCIDKKEIKIVQVDAGLIHACALTDTSEIYCWGYNSHGQLGNGPLLTKTDKPTSKPVKVAGSLLWKSFSAGGVSTCAISAENKLYCWGSNDHKELSADLKDENGKIVGKILQPTLVSSDTWQVVSLGNNHSCGIKTDGRLCCWGSNSSGQLNGKDSDYNTDQNCFNDTWLKVASGQVHSCAIKADKSQWCWGGGASEGLNKVKGTDKALDIFSYSQNCMLTDKQGLKCWGDNNEWELGWGNDSTQKDTSTPGTPKDICKKDKAK